MRNPYRIYYELLKTILRCYTHWYTCIAKFRGKVSNYLEKYAIITTRLGITCIISVVIKAIYNAYMPRSVHFQYRPQGAIGVGMMAIRNAVCRLDERITWLFGRISLRSMRRGPVDTMVTDKRSLGLNQRHSWHWTARQKLRQLWQKSKW